MKILKYDLDWKVEKRDPDFNPETHSWQGEGYPDDEKLVVTFTHSENGEGFEIELFKDELENLYYDILEIMGVL